MKYAVRLVHTVAAALVVGGTVLLWAQLALPQARGDGGHTRDPGNTATTGVSPVAPVTLWGCVAYEWGCWTALGLLVMTGIGNLAVFGAALPGAETDWGQRLLFKLAGVAVLVLFSAWRTLVVARHAGPWPVLGLAPAPSSEPSRNARRGSPGRTLRNVYGVTALLSTGVLALAAWLAHP